MKECCVIMSLLNYYLFLPVVDWRVTPLIILIKQWASAQGINDASQGTLSSYSLVLMVLNYLQGMCTCHSGLHVLSRHSRILNYIKCMYICYSGAHAYVPFSRQSLVLKWYLDNDTLKHVVRALVLSCVNYGSLLLFGATSFELDRDKRLQNSAARLILSTPLRKHNTPSLGKLHWLTIRE